VLALLGIALAFLARTQMLVLVVIFPLTLLLADRRRAFRAHPVAMAFTGALVLAGLGLIAAGGSLATLTVYGQEVQGGLLPHGTASWFLKHLAILALGLGLLPFVAGVAWLLANATRIAVSRERRVFACLGAVTVILLPLETTSYDLHVGGGIARDRYLFYVAPIVLLAFACALLDRRRPRWSLLLPAAAVTAGFAIGAPEPDYAWNDAYGRLTADSPVSGLFRPLVRDLHGMTTTRATLAVATVVLTVLFVLGAVLVRQRALALLLGTLLAAGLASETGYLFDRLLTADGIASRPLTTSPAPQYDWVDHAVGPGASVTMVPGPINENWFQTQQYWRDLEFWNASIVRDAHAPSAGTFGFTGLWFPKIVLSFDPRTGAANASPSPYVVEALKESRFRVSGRVVASTSDAFLIRAPQPWHADWITSGLYDDGWTMPHTTAHVRVFAFPGQTRPTLRYLSFQIWAPGGVTNRPFIVRSNLQTARGAAGSATAFVNAVHVCVPPRGFADVSLSTPDSSTIPGDLASQAQSQGSRQGGVFLAQIALADDLGGRCSPRHPA
jgi:hypothetical protein